ncbi:hypothetical protein Ahy_B02g061540 isoform A [Arachis hypogaea]|uniref:Protein kinase domain-containing protein n=1 Tax=Arachis hypogaea TaxID=3818 RepID=A0A445AL77_ARAHY|nr:hypothetical protein Ahy_B02g061540 isoform A [Arachis hypogaea]
MAASLVGGAAVGAVFGELLKAVLAMKDKAMMFRQTLAHLRTTLTAIAPVVKEIENHNNELGRPKEELESLMREMEQGTKLVYKCSKIRKLNFIARIRYQEQLVALVESLVKFFMIDLQAQTARDLKETLLEVRKISSEVSKLSSASHLRCSSSGHVSLSADLGHLEIHETSSPSLGSNAFVNRQSQSIFNTNIKADESSSPTDSVTITFPDFQGSSSNFHIDELLGASGEVLGMTSYGTFAYKAMLEDGTTLVVKRLRNVVVGKSEFDRQLLILQRLSRHPNIMPLLAGYYSKDEKLLIYDYIASCNLSDLLHEKRKNGMPLLDWDLKLKILLGVAKGVAHIHSSSEGEFVHGNISTSNILVTADIKGCISYFGLHSIFSGKSTNLFTRNKGYYAPEVIRTGILTQKSDVYGFGVVLFEILTGKLSSEYNNNDLQSSFNNSIRDDMHGRMLRKMMLLAEACMAISPELRPSMDEVVKKLEVVQVVVSCIVYGKRGLNS